MLQNLQSAKSADQWTPRQMLCDSVLALRQPLSASIYIYNYIYLPMHMHVLYHVTSTRARLLQ